VLHDVLTAKKSRTWVKIFEAIMFRYVDICVELQMHRHAKDGLHQYRNISQQQAPQSLEVVINYLVKAAETRAYEAADAAKKANLAAKQVADLDCEATPESIMLSTMTDEGDCERSEREVLVPWLKFLWETYRSVLDILRTNSKLEKVYHSTSQKAFAFCQRFDRKTELRRLCETLRQHLSNLQRAAATNNTNRLRGWEGWTQEGVEMHLTTRFAQLEVASALELWTEGFRTVEDIHQIMRISKKPPKAKLMARYYERLTRIFWVSGNHLFHAYAWRRHVQLATEAEKRPPTDEERSHRACSVLLSALAIPDASAGAAAASRPTVGYKASASPLADDDVDAEKNSRMANLLGFVAHPTRAALLSELRSEISKGDGFPPHVKALYEALETTFSPLSLAKIVEPLLEDLKTKTPRLAHFVEPLARLAVSRLVAQLGEVYSVVTLETFKGLLGGLPLPYDDVEKLLVGAGTGAKGAPPVARLDYRRGCLRFVDAGGRSARGQPLGPKAAVSEQLAELRAKLDKAVDALRKRARPAEIVLTPEKKAKRAALFAEARAAAAADHERALARKAVIERRKEEQERLQQEKAKAEAEEKKRLEDERKLDEAKRLEREARDREREKLNKMKAELQLQEAKETMKALGKDVGDDVAEMDEKERQKLIQETRDAATKKRLAEDQRLAEQARRLDYVSRALRLEELPVLEARYAQRLEEDAAAHEKDHAEAVERERKAHAASLVERARLAPVLAHRAAFEKTVLARRRDAHAAAKAEAEAKHGSDRVARKVARARRRYEDAEEEKERARQEDEDRAAEAAEAAAAASEYPAMTPFRSAAEDDLMCATRLLDAGAHDAALRGHPALPAAQRDARAFPDALAAGIGGAPRA